MTQAGPIRLFPREIRKWASEPLEQRYLAAVHRAAVSEEKEADAQSEGERRTFRRLGSRIAAPGPALPGLAPGLVMPPTHGYPDASKTTPISA